jgi:hypothetical protein
LAVGFRHFETLGIDRAGGYSPLFFGGPQTEKPRAFFERNWERIRSRVLAGGGTIEGIA